MSEKTLKNIIDEIVKDAFKRIEYAYQHQCEPSVKIPTTIDEERETKTRLVFPRYTKSKKGKNGKTRISEQELRFAFIEAFNAYCENEKIEDLYYSIETPTENRYSDFSSNPHRDDRSGRSGEFDLVIFKKENAVMKRSCLIEFKAKNATEIDHWKDLLKLKAEGSDILCYFIEVLKSFDDETKKSLKEDKFEMFLNIEDYKQYINNGAIIHVRCYALEGESNGRKTEGVGSEIDFTGQKSGKRFNCGFDI